MAQVGQGQGQVRGRGRGRGIGDGQQGQGQEQGSDECSYFKQFSHRLNYLEKWYELAIRPLPEDCHLEDQEMLLSWEEGQDDLKTLEKKCLETRNKMNDHLPPHELALDDMLVVAKSCIPNAGNGLFYQQPSSSSSSVSTSSEILPMSESAAPPPTATTTTTMTSMPIASGTTICYYTGHRHNFLSQKYISDKSYLMNVASDIMVDPGPLLSIKARYINDPLNPNYVNCTFVPEPELFRSAVVAKRDIYPGEELYVSYGDIYWSNAQRERGDLVVGNILM